MTKDIVCNTIRDGYSALYPSIMIRYDLLSRSLPKAGKERFKDILDIRVKAKKAGDKNTANALKIVANSMFGTSRDPKSLMYDPRNGRSVCVAGQLLLLDYIEHLEKATDKIQFVQYNTDGVFFTYDDTDETFNLIDDVTYEWEKRTGLNMEFEDYRSMYQFNVNNYIAVAADGSMHCKGQYLKEKNAIDNDYPIVREALVNYLVHDIIPEKTIYGCRDLAMFAHTIKLTGKYKYITRNFRYDHGRAVADPSQKVDLKVFRIFAVRDIFQGTLYKVKEDDTIQRFSDTPDHVLIYNDDVKGKPVPDNLDYDWYVRLTYERASGLKTPGTLDSLL